MYRLTGVQGPTDVALPMLPTLDSERVGDQPYGICDVGHLRLLFNPLLFDPALDPAL